MAVFTKENLDNFNFENFESNVENLDNVYIDRENIKKLINELNVNKAMGPDNIHSRVLKEGVESISHALEIIFSRSLRYGEIPSD